MKPAMLAGTGIIGATLAASLTLGSAPTMRPVATDAVVLPVTGPAAAVIRIRHGVEMESIAMPVDLYEQFVPPAPAPAAAPVAPPRPVAATRVLAAGPYTPPAGLVTINVPVYR